MHIAITGANGFVGRALAARLRQARRLGGHPIERLTLLDLHADVSGADEPGVHWQAGDIADADWLARALAGPPLDVLFHLASLPGGSAEQDYPLARRVNLDATTALLEHGRAQPRPPVFVFASSIAVYGEMPSSVDDDTPTRPQMTYGAQKLIGEVLVADFSRRGWVDGRSLRLPGVLARPPAPTGQLSAFLSDLPRELAAGRPFTCPMSPQATTWASSRHCVVEQLLHAATLDAALLQGRRTLLLPTLRFSMAELVDAVGAVHGTDVAARVRWAPQERIEALFGRFPPLRTAASEAAGFVHDGRLTDLVRRALHGAGEAAQNPAGGA